MMHRKILMRPIKIYESKVIKIKMCQLYLNGPVDDVINFLQIFLRTSEIDPGAWTVFRRGGLVLGDPRLPSHLELQHRDEIWTVSCCHKKVVESWSVDFRFSTPSVDFSCLSLIDNVFFICLVQGDANPGPLLLIYSIVQCLRPLGCWFPNLYLFYPFLSIVAVDSWIGSLSVDLLRTMSVLSCSGQEGANLGFRLFSVYRVN